MSNFKIQHSKVLVTGGAGFIGSNLCDFLLRENNKVVCLDNFSTGSRLNIAEFLSNPNFTLVEGDIRNYEDCQNAVRGCGYVFHQAALGSVPRSIKDPVTSTDVNVGGFVKVLYAAVGAGVKRFVYAASSSTYGDHPDLPKVEHKIGRSLSPYAITKYVDELFAENFSATYGIETVGLRYFNVFGRKQSPNGAYAAVIPKFVSQLIKHESPVINGDGAYSRDFTYIDNVLQANMLAASVSTNLLSERRKIYYQSIGKNIIDEAVIAEVFNVAYGERTSLLELVKYLKENLSCFDPEISAVMPSFGEIRNGDIPHSLADISKGKHLFGYSPVYSVQEGIKLASQWYWENLK